MLVLCHVTQQEHKLKTDRKEFRETKSVMKEEKEKEMRFSFYNTMEKSQFFLKRFKKDSFLD
jgi:hypothetical protein